MKAEMRYLHDIVRRLEAALVAQTIAASEGDRETYYSAEQRRNDARRELFDWVESYIPE